MKTDIHPEYNMVTVTCSCGTTFETRSTATELSVELCSQCHPFYTGKQKLVDTGGRIDRFERRFGKRKRPGKGGEAAPTEDASAAADAPAATEDAPAASDPEPEAADAAADAPSDDAPNQDASTDGAPTDEAETEK